MHIVVCLVRHEFEIASTKILLKLRVCVNQMVQNDSGTNHSRKPFDLHKLTILIKFQLTQFEFILVGHAFLYILDCTFV